MPELNDAESSGPPLCLFCTTILQWFDEAWPADVDGKPVFVAREAGPFMKLGANSGETMPFCQFCSQLFLAAVQQFHRERVEREGATQRMVAVAEPNKQIATPERRILLPGQPGFKRP